MAAVKEIYPGVFLFEPEQDPGIGSAKRERFEQWKSLFDQVHETCEQMGWDSPECQSARIQLSEWQQQKRRDDLDQINNTQYTI